LNVPGFERGALARGGTIVRAGELEESACVDAELHWLPICPAPLNRRTRFLFHALTTQEDVAVQLLDRVPLLPGGRAPVRLHLGRAVALLPGDRFVLRGFRALAGHGTVVGGGTVVRVAVTPRRRTEPGAGDLVRAMATATAIERVFLEVQASASDGLPRPALAGRIGVASGAAEVAVATLVAAGRVVVLGAEPGHLMTSEAAAGLESAVLERLDRFHAATPLAPGISRAALRTSTPRVARLEPRAFGGIVDRLAARGAVQGDADLVRRAGFSSGAAESARAALVDRVAAALGQGALAPPTPPELAAALGATPAVINESLAILCRRGSVLRIKSDLYFDRDAVASLRERLLAFLRAHQQITPQEWKALVGSTRKFTIPLAEHFDAEKLTFRVGEVRRLRVVPGCAS
jgi:selenocysteine-specific elongation factor